MTTGVILYGPPAAGKDTVTAALNTLDPRFVPFPRIKVGPGRATGYRMATDSEVEALRAQGHVIWENHRYQACYIVDRPELLRRLADHMPVLHLGQVAGIDAVIRATPGVTWLVVHLWCPREVAAERIVARDTGDVEDRLRAWDETKPLDTAHLVIDTSQVPAEAAARTIRERVDALRVG